MASWRAGALVMVTGLASGTLGALLYAHLAKPPARSPVAVATERPQPPAPVIIPPGWDPALVSRLANVEQKLDEMRSPAALSPAAAEAPADAGPNDEQAQQRQRAAEYQEDLDYLEKALADHASEPTDGSWAGPLVASMQQSLGKAFEGAAQTKSVDCRSKTCTATLSFPTPKDALVSLQQTHKLQVQGCKGFAAIPTPPTGAGPYDLTVVYNCR